MSLCRELFRGCPCAVGYTEGVPVPRGVPRVSLCREVFRESLNESRDVDRGDSGRYTSRFFLKHSFLEQAFDALLDAGFHMISSCGSGTNNAGGDVKPGMDGEESRWNHYNEFVFCRY